MTDRRKPIPMDFDEVRKELTNKGVEYPPESIDALARALGRRDFRLRIGVAVICLFVILGVQGWAIVLANRNVDAIQETNRGAALCLLEQLAEHRIATRQHIESVAAQYGHPVPTHEIPQQLENPERFRIACESYFMTLEERFGPIPNTPSTEPTS